MAKSKTSKKSKKDAEKKDAEKKAAAKARARATAKLAALIDEAKRARKSADKAVKSAEKAETAAVAAGAPAPKAGPSEADLLRLALRSAEAKLTDAERRVEALEQQIADFHRRDEQVIEESLEEAIVDAAVVATVEEAVVDAELAQAASEAAEAEAVAEELDEIVAETGAEVEAVGAADQPSSAAPDLTPPLPEEPADDGPNETWTLLRLRAEAKRRGLTGTSNLPKAALLERLREG